MCRVHVVHSYDSSRDDKLLNGLGVLLTSILIANVMTWPIRAYEQWHETDGRVKVLLFTLAAISLGVILGVYTLGSIVTAMQ